MFITGKIKGFEHNFSTLVWLILNQRIALDLGLKSFFFVLTLLGMASEERRTLRNTFESIETVS